MYIYSTDHAHAGLKHHSRLARLRSHLRLPLTPWPTHPTAPASASAFNAAADSLVCTCARTGSNAVDNSRARAGSNAAAESRVCAGSKCRGRLAEPDSYRTNIYATAGNN